MTVEINHNSIVPLYKQVLKVISDKIKNGELKPGDKLPSETVLMEEFDVSRITIRGAVTELVEEGILERSQGKGTFVAVPKELYHAYDHYGFTRSCLLAGKTPDTKLISAELIYPAQQHIEFFNIPETEKIVCTKRLRYVDDEPTMIETNHYSPSFAFLLNENLEGSLFELLETKYKIFIANSIRTLEVSFPVKDEAALLGVKQNQPLLLFIDEQSGQSGESLFISKQLYCTERLKFYL